MPLAVMDQLEKVPANWLKQLATDKDIFKDLPARVQRQVRARAGAGAGAGWHRARCSAGHVQCRPSFN